MSCEPQTRLSNWTELILDQPWYPKWGQGISSIGIYGSLLDNAESQALPGPTGHHTRVCILPRPLDDSALQSKRHWFTEDFLNFGIYALLRWTKMGKLYTVTKNKTGSWLWLRSWTPYCQIQTQIEESRENHLTIQVWLKSNPLWLYSGSEK